MRAKIIFAFTGIYVVWGSTYLAIRFTVETLPELLTAGVRFLSAGLILFAVMRFLNKQAMPNVKQWRGAAIVGALLILGGNGNVVLASRYVPSSLIALFLAAMPVWTLLLNWLWLKGPRPSFVSWVGVVLGIGGVLLLILPHLLHIDGHDIQPLGIMGLMAASLLWSIGSVYARKAHLPASILMATSMQMIAGGCFLLLFGLLRGELSHIHVDQFSLKSILAFVYLIFFGALWGYSAYSWLIQKVGAVAASTCGFVNPIVAVFLGWLLAGEHLTFPSIVAAVLVILAVMIITFEQYKLTRMNKRNVLVNQAV